jgi:2'-hydroxyisoflavone reductase
LACAGNVAEYAKGGVRSRPTRREFLDYVGRAAVGLVVPYTSFAADRSLEILVMGGTGFIGPHIVRAALNNGHNVTLFNRGRTSASVFPELETITGDRNTAAIEQLAGRRWDAVIDTSAYFPRSVNMTLDALGENVEHYVLISTISVYTTWSIADMDESAPVRRIADSTIEEIRQPATYGALKALCEDAANARMQGRVTNVRPGFIVGPGDETDRLTYWPVRVSRGGEVLAPGTGGDYVQFIDVRDLADWLVNCLEHKVIGTFNAHAGARQLTMAGLLDSCRELPDETAEITWVDSSFLEQHRVIPQVDMPIWLPGGMQLSAERARSNGLSLRAVTETIADTYDWFMSLPTDRRSELRIGISSAREADVLRAWHETVGSVG